MSNLFLCQLQGQIKRQRSVGQFKNKNAVRALKAPRGSNTKCFPHDDVDSGADDDIQEGGEIYACRGNDCGSSSGKEDDSQGSWESSSVEKDDGSADWQSSLASDSGDGGDDSSDDEEGDLRLLSSKPGFGDFEGEEYNYFEYDDFAECEDQSLPSAHRPDLLPAPNPDFSILRVSFRTANKLVENHLKEKNGGLAADLAKLFSIHKHTGTHKMVDLVNVIKYLNIYFFVYF